MTPSGLPVVAIIHPTPVTPIGLPVVTITHPTPMPPSRLPVVAQDQIRTNYDVTN